MRPPEQTRETSRCVEYNWKANEENWIKLTIHYQENRKYYVASLRPFVSESGGEAFDLTDVVFFRYSARQSRFNKKTFIDFARDTRDNLDSDSILPEILGSVRPNFQRMVARITGE